MSRMVTSVASFSSQRAAMRRACSSVVRSVSFLGRDGPDLARIDGVQCTGGSRTSGGAIEGEAVDGLGGGRRHEGGGRGGVQDAPPKRGGRKGQRRGREKDEALRMRGG